MRTLPTRESVIAAQHLDSVSAGSIQFTESTSSWSQACMKLYALSNVEHAVGNAVDHLGSSMLNSITAFFRGLFSRKDDNYKALLIADLGIER
jgi:hypothetical protein